VKGLSLLVLLAAGIAGLPAHADTILFSNLPAPQPYNLPSVGFEATQTAEFGALIQLASGSATLYSVNVLMSDWALASTYGSLEPGFAMPVTLNLYQMDSSFGTAQPGALLYTRTDTFQIPWRPEADPSCTGGRWMAANGACYGGLAVPIVFTMEPMAVPSELIFGIAFNTQHYGANPTGVSGPYNSLNVGLATAAPWVGSLPAPGTLYLSSANAGQYGDGGPLNVFRQAQGWAPYSIAAQFESVPEPDTLAGAAAGLAVIAVWHWRRKKNRLRGR
jgi:hypothetical protein